MRILLVHNTYKHRGGEDAVFEDETQLLRRNHQVETLLFDNEGLDQLPAHQIILNSISNKNSVKVLRDKITSFSPDIVHVHNLFYTASPSILAVPKEFNIPVVMTLHNFRLVCNSALLLREGNVCELCINKTFPIHGIYHKCFQNSALKSFQLTLITSIHKAKSTWTNNVDKYLVFSEFLKNKFIDSSLKLKSSQIEVKPNFVEDFGMGDYQEREDFYLFIGRLSEEKGVRIMLKAFEQSSKKLEIVGDGDLKNIVNNYMMNNKNVTYHGFQKKQFIIDRLKKCRALIFPSVWYEGMPITLLESFSTGTPVIISDQHNIRDYVDHEKDGLHFKNKSAEHLSAAINHFDEIHNNNFYVNSRRKYETLYSPEINLKQLETVYQNLLS